MIEERRWHSLRAVFEGAGMMEQQVPRQGKLGKGVSEAKALPRGQGLLWGSEVPGVK